MTTDITHLIPLTVDQLVRRNRDRIQFGFASEEEIAGLGGPIEECAPRQTLGEWRALAIRIDGESAFHLLGRVLHTGRTWVTSRIVAVDRQIGLVKTRNNTYGIVGDPALGQPDIEQVLLVAAWVGRDELGRVIDVIDVFF